MPRIALMSDVHSNLEALKEVFCDLETQDVTEVYCLGDMIGYGPQPQECVDLLRERDVQCLMGNHEQGMINIHYLRQFNQPAADALRFTRETISEETYEWLTTRPKALVVHDVRLVHGLPPDSVSKYIWKYHARMEDVFRRFTEAVCFVGHTHDLERFEYREGVSEGLEFTRGGIRLTPDARHIVNIGAVGQPRDGDNAAKYAVFDTETRTLDLRFVPYDIRKTADLIARCRLHRAFGDRLW